MTNFTALYDACVLYPAPLRDFLLQLAVTDLFRAKWTDKIHDEWMRSVLKQRPDISREQLERTKMLMNSHVRDCLVTGYEELEGTIHLPDPNDRHVLAAAIVGHAQVIITFNLKDFPESELGKYGIEAQHPDEFIAHLIDLSQQTVCVAAKKCRERLKHPAYDVDQYLDTLTRQQLTSTVSFLRDMRGLM
jgi:predicted nucleic acid-binding protein